METRDLERLAILETNTSNIEKLILRLDRKFDDLQANYVTKTDLAEALKYRDKQIESLQETNRWMTRSLATTVIGLIASVVLTLLK